MIIKEVGNINTINLYFKIIIFLSLIVIMIKIYQHYTKINNGVNESIVMFLMSMTN